MKQDYLIWNPVDRSWDHENMSAEGAKAMEDEGFIVKEAGYMDIPDPEIEEIAEAYVKMYSNRRPKNGQY